MANAVAQLDAITKYQIIPRLRNDWFRGSPVLDQMVKKASKNGTLLDSGTDVRCPIATDDEGNFKWFKGSAILDANTKDTITAFKDVWRFSAAGVSVADTDMLQNQGAQGIVKLWKSKLDGAKKTMRKKIATALFSSQAGESMSGFDDMLSAASVFGGIDPATYTDWKAKVTAAAGGVVDYQSIHQQILKQCDTGLSEDKPTIIACNAATYGKAISTLEPQKRFTNKDMASAGFDYNFEVDGVPVVIDFYATGSGLAVADNKMYFLNTDQCGLYIHKDWNFKVNDAVRPWNQAMVASFIFLAVGLWCASRRLQGVITGINPSL